LCCWLYVVQRVTHVEEATLSRSTASSGAECTSRIAAARGSVPVRAEDTHCVSKLRLPSLMWYAEQSRSGLCKAATMHVQQLYCCNRRSCRLHSDTVPCWSHYDERWRNVLQTVSTMYSYLNHNQIIA
jgi:hypothetical protein